MAGVHYFSRFVKFITIEWRTDAFESLGLSFFAQKAFEVCPSRSIMTGLLQNFRLETWLLEPAA